MWLTNRKQLGEAVLKLEKLKTLEAHVTDLSMSTLLHEVNVNILRGNVEEVKPDSLITNVPGPHYHSPTVAEAQRRR